MKEEIEEASTLFFKMMVDREMPATPSTQQTQDFHVEAEEAMDMDESISTEDPLVRVETYR